MLRNIQFSHNENSLSKEKMLGLTPRRGNTQTQKLKDTCGKFKGLPTTARAHGQNFDGGTAALQSLRRCGHAQCCYSITASWCDAYKKLLSILFSANERL